MVCTEKRIDGYDIYIFTEGGKVFGYGHIMRCLSLYDEFVERGYRPIFIINGDDEIKDTLNSRQYIIASWYGKSNLYLKNRPYSIIDSYHAEVSDYEEIHKHCRKTLYIDDIYRLDYPKGSIVNPSVYSDKIHYKKQPGQTYLLGSQYVILRKEFTVHTIRAIKENVEHVLVIMGGSDITNLTPHIIQNIRENYIGIKKVHVIIGNGFGNVDEIEQVSKNTKIQLYYNLNAKDLRNVMLHCDIAVSAAGQTTNELIATQLPFICIKIADNQRNNIKGLLSNGIIYDYIDNSESRFDIYKFEKLFKETITKRTRENIISKMAGLDLKSGARNIVNEFLS